MSCYTVSKGCGLVSLASYRSGKGSDLECERVIEVRSGASNMISGFTICEPWMPLVPSDDEW